MSEAVKKPKVNEREGKINSYNDLDSLAGTWSEEDADEFDKTTEDFRKVDAELWRKNPST
jgi:hypothetical protein